jgi:tol-pal system protein YbgF
LPPYANQLPSESDYPESPISNSGEYQPGYGNTPTTQDPVGGQVSVEERVISASGLPTTAANSNFPPVVDRSVGTQGMQDATTIVLPPAYQAGDQVAYRRNPIDGSQIPVDMESSTASTSDARANNPMGAVVLAPTVGSQAGGVIAIPDGSANRIQNNVIRNRSGDASYSSQAPVASMSEQEFYQQGFGLLKESKHSEAINIFKQQISNYPSGNYADDAHYWIAESMYVNRSLDESKQYFRAIIDNYSQSSRLPDAMLKTAYIEQEQGNVIEARILLQEIVQYHPRSNAAISAKNRLAEL